MLTILIVGNSTTAGPRRAHGDPPGVSHVILLLGGTSDARDAGRPSCARAGYEVLVSTVSEYGARLAAPRGARACAAARWTRTSWRGSSPRPTPSWTPRTRSRRSSPATARRGLRTRRPAVPAVRAAGRRAAATAWCCAPRTPREAARLAVERRSARRHASDGDAASRAAILLTVGSKTVGTYARAARERRRAPGRARAARRPRRWRPARPPAWSRATSIAMQGPTSAELDAALLRHLGATVLVTKESGDAGGLGEKLRAAELAGATRDRGASGRPAAGRGESQPAARRGRRDGGRRARLARGDQRAAAGRGRPARLLRAASCRSTPATARARPRPPRARRCAPAAPAWPSRSSSSSRAAGRAPSWSRCAPPGCTSCARRCGAAACCAARPRDEDRAAAAAAWAAARAALSDAACDLVVLDELHAALRHGLVELDEVLAALAARPSAPGGRHHRPRRSRGAARRGRPRHRDDRRPPPYPDVPARRGIEL